MADEIVDKCAQLQLVNNDDDVVDLSAGREEKSDETSSLRVVGKLLTEKPINFDALKRTMTNVWNLQDGVIIRAIDANVFVFQCFHWQDKEKVMSGRPWCFEQRLLLLQEISNFAQPYEVNLIYSAFWIRLYNLPFGLRSDELVRSIASSIGEVMEVEEELLKIEPFRMVRINLNTLKPLKQTQKVKLKGGKLFNWV
ncbi:unnamed protein product [Amaranthus hypochondriacus]